MLIRAVCGLVVALSLAAAQPASMPAPACNLVPGWTQSGAPRTYEADNLYEYMDGNSEGYISYGFQKMRGVTCKKGEVVFVIDISDMWDTDSAYGMFAANRDLRLPAYPAGMGGQIVPRRLLFAKGQYYVEIAANPDGDHTAALKEWAAALDKLVQGASKPPEILSWFPAEKQQTLRLVPESVLGMRLLKRGYMAQYDYGKAFIILEETPESAAAVMQKLRERFAGSSPAKIGEEAIQATDKYLGKMVYVRKGRYIAGWAITGEGVDPVAASTQLAGKIH
jgi:hypothetical protein